MLHQGKPWRQIGPWCRRLGPRRATRHMAGAAPPALAGGQLRRRRTCSSAARIKCISSCVHSSAPMAVSSPSTSMLAGCSASSAMASSGVCRCSGCSFTTSAGVVALLAAWYCCWKHLRITFASSTVPASMQRQPDQGVQRSLAYGTRKAIRNYKRRLVRCFFLSGTQQNGARVPPLSSANCWQPATARLVAGGSTKFTRASSGKPKP